MTLGTFVVSTILIVVVGLIIFSMIRAKKNGKSLHCSACSACSSCGNQCSCK